MAIFDGIDLRHLRALDVLLDECHVSRAAEKLALTQPAVSNSLARLREHFGDELLVRDGAQLIATPFAESIQSAVRNILLDVHAVTSARPGFDPKRADRTFTIMVPDHVASMVLPAVVRELRVQSPKSRVVCQNPSPDSRLAFARGEIDLAIMPEPLLVPAHPHQAMFEERWVYIARRGHPSALTTITSEELGALPSVEAAMPRSSEPAGIAQSSAAAIVPATLVSHVVAGTDLVALVPRSAALFHAKTLGIQTLSATPSRAPTAFHMQWHSRRDTDPASKWVRDLVRATAVAAFDHDDIDVVYQEDHKS